jgi:hypothetical protein
VHATSIVHADPSYSFDFPGEEPAQQLVDPVHRQPASIPTAAVGGGRLLSGASTMWIVVSAPGGGPNSRADGCR